ncbi:hypothetical protein H2200_009259 [Cladophialophora chaetospira]|uniref:Saccharopine dehydrogenase NADP binding domain-containing protein n=1 Tax=Cladophialophora chaetospira TaxID=386627 RepID=A0AA38X426_9EURO|nr:hypothetical protein H2200_009259 [Cladophialophora chaetospira]
MEKSKPRFKKHGRRYDIVVFGATGYSGSLTAEHIATNLPSDLKWAVAGRSVEKLSRVVARCKELAPDCSGPEIEVCQLNHKEITALAKRTFCFIAIVGPYSLYGEHAFKACAENGTHYLDCTPEVPWTLSMIQKYEASAKASGACMFPQCAMEFAPSDLLTWAVAAEARSKFSSPIGDVVLELHQLRSIPSGGTVHTLLNLFDQYSLKTLNQSVKPYALSPIPNSILAPKKTFWSSLTGLTHVPGLGTLTTSVTGKANEAIVFRTWGLMQQEPGLKNEFYGSKFTYREYMYAHGVILGMMTHYSVLTCFLLILLPPFRSLLKKLFKQGEGPNTEKAKNEVIELRAVANPDAEANFNKNRQVFGKLSYHGSMYYLTAALLAQGARTLLEDDSARLTGESTHLPVSGKSISTAFRRLGSKFDTEIQNL